PASARAGRGRRGAPLRPRRARPAPVRARASADPRPEQRRSRAFAPYEGGIGALRQALAYLVRVTQSATPNLRLPNYDEYMCGIAGFSLGKTSTVDRTRAAQALLAGIAERGADAVGYAHRAPGEEIVVHKQRSGASAMLELIAIPAEARQVLLHVRDYTKGHPRIDANNHPVRHGAVVGIHNGHIANDDVLMAKHGFERAAPAMTVDSEVIFAVAEANGGTARGFDERHPELLYLARGVGRPLWVGTTRRELFFASTREALEIAERYTGLRLRK